MKRASLVIMFLLLAGAIGARGETYFVNGELGADGNTGSQAQPGGDNIGPLQTIAAAVGKADATVINIAGVKVDGSTQTYAETITVNKAVTMTGTGASRPIITAAAGQTTTITCDASAGDQAYENLDIRGLTGPANYVIMLNADTDKRTFTNCLITGGKLQTIRTGGATGLLTFTGCTIAGETDPTPGTGYVTDNVMRIANSPLAFSNTTITGTCDNNVIVLDNNDAGAVTMDAVSFTPTGTTGAGLYCASGLSGDVTVTNSTFAPTALGSNWINISGTGKITVSDSSFSGPTPSAQYIKYLSDDELAIRRCQFTITGAGLDNIFLLSDTPNASTVEFTDNTITATHSTSGPMVYVHVGTHPVLVARNTITSSATDQAQAIIKTKDCVSRVVGNTIAMYSTAASGDCIHVTSTGTDAPGSVVANNTIRCRHLGGHVILIGEDGSSAGNDLTNFGIIEGNRIWGPGYYGAAANTFNVHGCMLGFNKQGQIRYNYLNGVGMGLVAKAGTGGITTYAGLGGIHHNVTVNCSTYHAIVSGIDGVVIEYNTMYQGVTPHTDGRPMILVKKEDDQEVYCANTVIRNNILYGFPHASFIHKFYAEYHEGHTGTVIRDNCFYMPGAVAGTDLWQFGAAVDANRTEFMVLFPDGNVFTDPRFTARGRDFRLLSNSPCVNWQTPTGRLAIRSDHLGVPQMSMGALPAMYEGADAGDRPGLRRP